MPHLDLHIDRLVVEGLGPLDAEAVRAAVAAELARLFAEEPTPPGIQREGHTARLDGDRFDVAPGTDAEAVGHQIAQAIHGGLSR